MILGKKQKICIKNVLNVIYFRNKEKELAMRVLKEFLRLKWGDIKDSILFIVPTPRALIVVASFLIYFYLF